MNIMIKNKIYIFFALIFLCSCAIKQDYRQISYSIQNNQCDKAIADALLKEKDYGDNAHLLFLVDMAMINMQCKKFKEANEYFEKAKTLAEKLYTESISKGTLSFVTNDLTIPYSGEDFERVLINLFAAISYLEQGQMDSALVECRQLNTLLTLYNSKYEEKKNVYSEDAFARYLSGILYEAEGSLDDAYIDYKKAYQTYIDYNKHYATRLPSFVKRDLFRLSYLTHREDEFKNLYTKDEQKKILEEDNFKEKGKLVFIYLNGLAPVKEEEMILVMASTGPIKIAFPKYVLQGESCYKQNAIIKKTDKVIETQMEIVENIDKIAIQSLDDRKGRIWAKTIARLVAKQVAISAVANQTGNDNMASLVKFGLNLANAALLEKADTRSWQSLPSKIYMTREFLEPGDYEVLTSTCYNSKAQKISLKKGETKYIIIYSMF